MLGEKHFQKKKKQEGKEYGREKERKTISLTLSDQKYV